MIRKILIICPWVLVFPSYFLVLVNAQIADTMKVLNCSAMPGDTSVAISISLHNTFPVAGISFRIAYNNNLLRAIRVETAGTRVNGKYNSFVTQTGPGWLYWCGINYYDPMYNSIPLGVGLVAKVLFSIHQNAPIGAIDTIRLVNDNDLYYYNALSDTFGTLIFPILINGKFVVGTTKVNDSDGLDGPKVPQFFTLYQNYPNPFNLETMIKFALPTNLYTRLNIYNLTGQLVNTLVDDQLEAGYHLVHWDSKDNSGKLVASGLYFYEIVAENFLAVKKMVVSK